MDQRITVVVRVLNSRGEIIGSREVRNSFTMHRTMRTAPTINRAMVSAEPHEASLELKPTRRQTTPETIRNSPRKSNFLTWYDSGLGVVGFSCVGQTRMRSLHMDRNKIITLRKHRRNIEMAPVGRLMKKHHL